MLALDTEVQIQALKRRAPRVKIVLGGHHPTFYADEWLQRGADAVVRHEGERTFPEIIARWERGETLHGVAGVSWRRDGEIVHEADRPLLAQLDDLPWPVWSIVDFGLYDLGLLPRGLTATIETSRGCGFHCNFCAAAAMWKNRQRFKSPARVIAEFDRLYELGVRQFMIADDNFGVHRERDLEIFRHLRDRDAALWAFVRADTVYHDREWTAAATRAGLRMALIGYENLSRDVLGAYRKQQKGDLGFEEYREVYRRLKAGGCFVYGLFVRDYDFSGADAWSARRIAAVCDISAQSRYIPMRGVPGAEKLSEQGYAVKDMFYHDRFWPSFTHEGRVQKSRFAGALIVDLLKPRNLVKLLAGSFAERTFFRRLMRGLWADVSSATPKRLRAAWIAAQRRTPPQTRQERIVRLFLEAPS
jgi:hypothetical protein